MKRRAKAERLCMALPIPRNAWHIPLCYVGRPGKTNSFAFSPARINKPTMWSSSEAKRNWAAFCCSYGRALVRAGILLLPQLRGPTLASLQAGNAWGACARLSTRNPKAILLAPEYLLSVVFPWTVYKCAHAFFLKDTSVPQLTRPPLKWIDDLSVLSVFRVFCSSLSSAPVCPQWDLSAFRYSVSKSKGSPYWSLPIFLVELPLLMKCSVTLVSQTRLQGLFLKDDGGNDLSPLHCEFPQHRITDHAHLDITEQDLTLWTSYCPSFG